MEKTIKDLLHFNIFYNYKLYRIPNDWEQKLIISLKDFIEGLKIKAFTNYDGWGNIVYRNRVLTDAKLFLMDANEDTTHIHFNGYNIKLKVLDLIFHEDIKIIWYNK